MKIVFLGTPQFAVPSLQSLNSAHEVVLVVSQPDKAKDRKGNYIFSEVKKAAQRLNLPLRQYDNIKWDGVEELKSIGADIFVTAAYGQILSQEILDIPRYGVLNVHASLLPKYRGSSPVQHAILNGEEVTGITIMQTDIGLDTGDIILRAEERILFEDTTDTLLHRLSLLGADLLLKSLEAIEKGEAKPIKQNSNLATKCPLITKQMGYIDFSDSALNIYNRIRAIPCHTYIDGEYTKLIKVKILDNDKQKEYKNIEVGAISNDLVVRCKQGMLQIEELQPQNKRKMTKAEYISGRRAK